jgi:hypothetical protein
MAKRAGSVTGDLPLLTVLLIGLQELRVLLLDLLRGLVRRAKQQMLELVVQVLAGRRGHLLISDPRRQVPHKRRSRGSDRGQVIGLSHRWPL